MTANAPLQIGITGGIGSGKSLVSRMFATLGIPIYDADTRAKWLMNHHPGLRAAIGAQFGAGAYHADGSLNRPYLATQVFHDGDQIVQLNALVHPKVSEDYAEWVLVHARFPYLLKEAALLYESQSYRLLHRTITVYAPIELRTQRIRHRDPHRTEVEIRAIIAKQISEEERLAMADHVVYNDNSRLVLPQVLTLHEKFLRKAEG
ncbi:MAG: dephospho-CoA kinase [Ferruginibacter sp.]|nr:dephospho-CoA kinase [Cytophagales bacterium]